MRHMTRLLSVLLLGMIVSSALGTLPTFDSNTGADNRRSIVGETQSTLVGNGVLRVADTRTVPKEKQKEKEKEKEKQQKEPPSLPRSAIPGASNPGAGNDSGKKTDAPKSPPGNKDDHCKGSPNCSKTFDGGR